ncbi:sulfatase-like hydrolase/transferase [Mucilaginibacter sp. PAMB04168]|uniref:sulfatase-like hydrolase/transferase n=1 Tax=Mucilaginibacter sp. PAMB04168 TaxID=3138567 RepID=UPI0031F6FA7B
MKKINFTIMFACFCLTALAQPQGSNKMVIITFDGLRWKEVFSGADSAKLFSQAIKAKDSVQRITRFWSRTPQVGRSQIMPFLWSTIKAKGQLYGNRNLNSNVNVTNPYWFSYPGYNEIFTGFADKRINSNDYGPNPNITLPEFINQQPGYKNSVAAFASWAAFDRILNKDRCGFPVNAGYTTFMDKNLTEAQKALNNVQPLLPKTFGNNERPDAVTYFLAKEYMKQNHPKVLQISFIETDAYAHRNLYYEYLSSAYNNDKMIEDVWSYIQRDPFYKDQTTLFIVSDHGRGNDQADNWTHHNSKEAGSDQVWFAVIGPGVKAIGETQNIQVYQNQYARTMAALLGITFKSPNTTGQPIETVLKK